MTQRTILTTRISGRPPSSSPRPKSARDFTRNNEQSRVRGGGRCAGLRPPPKLHRRICRMQLSRRLNETRGQGKESKQPSAQARTRRKAGTQAAVSSHACANASIDATRPAEVDRYCLLAPSPAGPIARSVVWRMPADSAHLHLVCSKISNALKRLGFRSRTFFAQLLSETSRACTIRVRRSSLRRLWNALGSHACLHHRNRRPGPTTEERISGSRAKFRKSSGRPRVDEETERLVVRMAKENPGWGCDRIVGAMANLGHRLSDQTVGNILRRHDIPPAPKRKQTTSWKDFIRAHMAVLVATDFFTVEVLTLRGLITYYVLFFIHLESR